MTPANDEFEAFLLEFLSDFAITIPELGTVSATRRPIVVLTSNRTRELHDALKRRWAQALLALGDDAELEETLAARLKVHEDVPRDARSGAPHRSAAGAPLAGLAGAAGGGAGGDVSHERGLGGGG